MTRRLRVIRDEGSGEEGRRRNLPSPESGRVLFNRYELKKTFRGPNSIVYRALDLKTGNHVAVKEVNLEHCRNAEGWKPMSMVAREFRVGKRLNHENLTAYHAGFLDEQGGSYFLVRDWVPGTSVQELLRQGIDLSRHVEEIVGRVLDAVEYLHNRKVVHRDIKPANIIVEFDGDRVSKVTLIDLGAVTENREDKDERTMPTTGFGTRGFIAPEALFDPCPASDMFSVGATLLKMLQGKDAEDIYGSSAGRYVIPRGIKRKYRKVLERTITVAVNDRASITELRLMIGGAKPSKNKKPSEKAPLAWRTLPLSMCWQSKLKSIIFDDRFEHLSPKRQMEFIRSLMQRFEKSRGQYMYGEDDLRDELRFFARITRLGYGEMLTEEQVVKTFIMQDQKQVIKDMDPEVQMRLVSRIESEEAAVRLLKFGGRLASGVEAFLASKIESEEAAVEVIKSGERLASRVQEILASKIESEEAAVRFIGKFDDYPKVQRRLASRIESEDAAVRLLESGMDLDYEVRESLASKIESEGTAVWILKSRLFSYDLIQEIVASRIESEEAVVEVLRSGADIDRRALGLLVSKISEDTVVRLIKTPSSVDRRAQGLLALKIESEEAAVDLSKSPMPFQSRLILLGKIRNKAKLISCISSIIHTCEPDGAQLIIEELKECDLQDVERNVLNELIRPIVSEISSDDACYLLHKEVVDDGDITSALIGKITDEEHAEALLGNERYMNLPEAKRHLCAQISSSSMASKILLSGIVTDKEITLALIGKISDEWDAEILLENERYMNLPEAKILCSRIRSSQTAFQLLLSGKITQPEAQTELIGALNKRDAIMLLQTEQFDGEIRDLLDEKANREGKEAE